MLICDGLICDGGVGRRQKRADARRLALPLAIILAVAGSIVAVDATSSPLGAAPPRWLHTVVAGFSSRSAGYWLVFADGTVNAGGGAHLYGDASGATLKEPIVGGAGTASGKGYWLVDSGGSVYPYGDAQSYGSLRGSHLNEPVVAMAATNSGQGYWLAARDGGVFTFGDAHFYGSMGGHPLAEPIVGMMAVQFGIGYRAPGKGYRLLARDGGVFAFGDAIFYGSLPSRGLTVNDAVAIATVQSDNTYRIVRAGGQIDTFGPASQIPPYGPTPCDPIAAFIAASFGGSFRLVTSSGATIPYGNYAPGGNRTGRAPRQCPVPPSPVPNPPTISRAEYNSIQGGMSYEQVVSIVGGPGIPNIDGSRYRWHGARKGAYAAVSFRADQMRSKIAAGLT